VFGYAFAYAMRPPATLAPLGFAPRAIIVTDAPAVAKRMTGLPAATSAALSKLARKLFAVFSCAYSEPAGVGRRSLTNSFQSPLPSRKCMGRGENEAVYVPSGLSSVRLNADLPTTTGTACAPADPHSAFGVCVLGIRAG
jgi:hypothetical protein